MYEALWVLRWCWVTIHVDGRCVLVVMGRGGLWRGCGRLWWVVCESRMVVGVWGGPGGSWRCLVLSLGAGW